MSSTDSPERQFSLRIERGRTKHPERPIDQERFLIGAGSNCHLQLGGEMPILHSVIIPVEAGLWIDAVVQEPQLLVNRSPVRESALHKGDLVEIGDFVFVVDERTLGSSENVVEDDSSENVEDENVDLREISAEDLIDLLGEEIRAIEEVEAAQVSGADALMEAAEQTQDQQSIDSLAAELEIRSAELAKREELLSEKASHLQKAQGRLENYLQQLTAQAQQETDKDGDNPFRKTA
ncbi:FHA domain-containing protein [Thalassoglobus polymorphus]|uniref:YscD cytoplasmic domain-containing protein n=1 Tax=Thalassoglobus polymorphus TaxID=2527994 RepID=A0A517QQ90_9PLAN|nr:FHA domain-containing protein [Thalassoglobus polymorphus]QDT33798.1 hypothetical protein Mal48_30530 [Thalassoglobus polymorphus]